MAVDDVSFNIKEGESFGLVGESGSGKTTLANALLAEIEDAQLKGIISRTTMSSFTTTGILRDRPTKRMATSGILMMGVE